MSVAGLKKKKTVAQKTPGNVNHEVYCIDEGKNKTTAFFYVFAYKYCCGLKLISVYTKLSYILVSHSCGLQLSAQEHPRESKLVRKPNSEFSILSLNFLEMLNLMHSAPETQTLCEATQ